MGNEAGAEWLEMKLGRKGGGPMGLLGHIKEFDLILRSRENVAEDFEEGSEVATFSGIFKEGTPCNVEGRLAGEGRGEWRRESIV